MKKAKWEEMLDSFKEMMLDAGAEVIGIKGARSQSFYPGNAVKGISYAMSIIDEIMNKYVNELEDGGTVSVRFRSKGSSIVLTFKKMSAEERMMRKSLQDFGILENKVA